MSSLPFFASAGGAAAAMALSTTRVNIVSTLPAGAWAWSNVTVNGTYVLPSCAFRASLRKVILMSVAGWPAIAASVAPTTDWMSNCWAFCDLLVDLLALLLGQDGHERHRGQYEKGDDERRQYPPADVHDDATPIMPATMVRH